MIDPAFFILGPDNDPDHNTFWNVDTGWTTDFDQATPFDGSILTDPLLPEGATGVMPHFKGHGIAQLDLLPGGGGLGAQNIFEKSY